MTFLGLDFVTYESKQGDVLYDEVLIKLTNRSTETLGKMWAYRVEFLYEGEWYIVFAQDEAPAVYMLLCRPKEEVETSFLVPAGLFDTPGKYRLYGRDVGYCYIDILFDPYEAASKLNLD